MKKSVSLAVVLALFTFVNTSLAQGSMPPKPNDPTSTEGSHTIHGSDNVPVGTATALLVTLGAGVTAYKLRKSHKEEK